MADHAHAHDHDAHSPQHYVKIWGVLLVLLVVSIAGPEVSKTMGSAGLYVMLFTAFGIAFVKAWLVIKHFMHLTAERPIVWYILTTCLVFMVLLVAGTAPDVHNHEGTNWENYAAKAEIERALAAHAAGEDGHGHGAHAAPAEEPPATPEHAEAAPAPAGPKAYADLASDGEKKSWLMARGAKVYAEAGCVTCHRGNGAGFGQFPTLVGQKDYMGDCARTLSIINNGLAEGITIGDVKYTTPMPPTKGLSAEDAAAVATYVRNSWGNDYGVCTP